MSITTPLNRVRAALPEGTVLLGLKPAPRWKLAQTIAGSLRLYAESVDRALEVLVREAEAQSKTSPEPAPLPTPTPAPASATPEKSMTTYEFLQGEVTAGRLELAAMIDIDEKRRLARVHGCNTKSIENALGKLRREARAGAEVLVYSKDDDPAPAPETWPDGGHIAHVPRPPTCQHCAGLGTADRCPDCGMKAEARVGNLAEALAVDVARLREELAAARAKIDRWRTSWLQLNAILEAVLPAEQLEEAQPIPQAVAWLAGEWKLNRAELSEARAEALFHKTQCEAAATRAAEAERDVARALSEEMLSLARQRLVEALDEIDRLQAVTAAQACALAAHETEKYELRREREEAIELDAIPPLSPGIRLALAFLDCDGSDLAHEKRLYAALLLYAHEHGLPVGARVEVAS